MGERIALFIDADNIPYKYGQFIMEMLLSRGEVFIRRIYGNWQKTNLHGWNEYIYNYGLNAIQQLDFASGKNATDMTIAVDVMDVLYRHDMDTFVIASSDSDFTPLTIRLREDKVRVMGIGNGQTVDAYRRACDEFIDLSKVDLAPRKIVTEAKPQPPVKVVPKAKTEPPPKAAVNAKTELAKMKLNDRFVLCGMNGMKQPKKKMQKIHDILQEVAALNPKGKEEFVILGQVGKMLQQKNLGYGIKDFGYSFLWEFIDDFPKMYELSSDHKKYRCLG